MDDTLMLYLIPVFTFVSVIAFIGASYYLWDMLHEAGSAKMQRRMRLLSAGGAHGEELLQQKHFSDIPFLNDILIGIPRVHAIDRVSGSSGPEPDGSEILYHSVYRYCCSLPGFNPGCFIAINDCASDRDSGRDQLCLISSSNAGLWSVGRNL